jgi:hypothetical protein
MDANCASMKKLPGILWFAVGALALMTLKQAVGYVAFDAGVAALYRCAVLGALAAGIVLGRPWAYWLTIAVMAFEVFLGLRAGFDSMIGALVAFALVLVPVLICQEHFPALDRGDDEMAAMEWTELDDGSDDK